MNKNYLTIALVFCLTFVGFAQNTVSVDASAAQLGYANVFETESNGGDQVANPTTFGTTMMTHPLTPDLAGRPTFNTN